MTAINRDGSWFVSHDGINIAGPFPDSTAAWRWIERNEGEPINPSEKRAAFGFAKLAQGNGL